MIIEDDNPQVRKDGFDRPGVQDRRSRISNPTPYSGLGKLPPQAVDVEEAILGALMLERDAFYNISDFLKSEHFYKDNHQKIYHALERLFKKGAPIDILTVITELRQAGELELIGGAYYVTELTNRVASAANIEYHGRIVLQKFLQREIIRISSTAMNLAYEDTTDVLDLLEQNMTALFNLSNLNESQQSEHIGTLVDLAIKEMDIPAINGLTGVGTGFVAMDAFMAGWQKAELTILAARPAMGKSALMMQLCRNAAVLHGVPVQVFSLEMPKHALTKRMISNETDIFLSKINKKTLTDADKHILKTKLDRLKAAPIHIDDTASLTVTSFRSKAKRAKQMHGIGLIVVDYLQLMRGEVGGKINRDQEIGQITRALKAVSKELDIPVIALCQLSRAADINRGTQRPRLSDLRESGNIEQDADNVYFLYRPAYYGLKDSNKEPISQEMAELICAKHRNGECLTIYLRWLGAVMRFENWVINGQPPIDFPKEENAFIIRPTSSDDDELPF